MVRRLIEECGLQARVGARGEVTVNVNKYDELRARYGDPSKEQGPRRDVRLPASGPSYRAVLLKKVSLEAQKREFELAEMKGNLIPVADLDEAATVCGERIVSVIDLLPNAADEVAVAVAKDGAAGARRVLRGWSDWARSEITAALDQMAAGSRYDGGHSESGSSADGGGPQQ